MGFWSFIRDMFVFDWLFGHHKKEPFTEQNDNHDFVDSGYTHYSADDYAQQDFDDDLDSGIFDDDF